ncbi:hypothetical protein DICSQDRAFT_47463 [Dichomitus squalens LYAD-421 SS1]|uniref:uncharacterized protein n=1 Tax=Dichomitus squalens (strain LYAD-421) TaxID=732165 RepID=UPI0004410AF7|nr:uncharacterized protein DICSQDRAFT_47463 [Dichomitus squalens LYAD-421 SS1]EJF66865.1 hypothetical protein DICSQDRAFT_47463 [Dichomitus squalens LYAD-421 SS1]
MDVFAGGVGRSDTVFKDFTCAIDDILSNTELSASLRHEMLQLAVIFVCGISQLSPGAYFLRHDLFPCIVKTIKSPDTEQFTFEAVLLLALLANFHKSDAAKLNPYLRRIRETEDEALMRMICWAANFALAAAVKAYQTVSDDSPPTLATSFNSFLSYLRPDRAFASAPVDPPRELFKNQPIEACVILLPLFEFLHGSSTFRMVFASTLQAEEELGKRAATRITPLPLTLISLSSYLFSHASSTSSPRAVAYANLAMSTLLVLVESDDVMAALHLDSKEDIRLCRQRQPPLPTVAPPRPPLCALLDCCILWLRHNLHKKLEVQCYLLCIRTCYRTLWYLQREHIRLEYHWQELWQALVLLLDFLANKLDSLVTTGGVEMITQETLLLVDLALCRNEQLFPSPKAVHELVYEVVRSAEVFRKQRALLEKLASPHARRRSSGSSSPWSQALTNISAVAEHYETKLREAGVRSANQGLRAVAKEIEKDGLSYGEDVHGTDDPP